MRRNTPNPIQPVLTSRRVSDQIIGRSIGVPSSPNLRPSSSDRFEMPKLALGHRREASDPGCVRAVLGELVLTFLFVFVGVGSAITGGTYSISFKLILVPPACSVHGAVYTGPWSNCFRFVYLVLLVHCQEAHT